MTTTDHHGLDDTDAADAAGTDEDDDVEVLPWWRNPLNLVAILVAVAVLAGGLGWLVGNNSAIDDPSDVDVGFLQDMRWHHDQAVQMSLVYLDRPDTDARLRTIARTIVVGQSIETGMMIQLLRNFGKSESNPTDTGMSWMGEPTPIDRMPGLATESDLAALSSADGADANRIFVTLMVAHHQGGIHMARYAADHAATSSVRNLATAMVTSQTDEIGELQRQLS